MTIQPGAFHPPAVDAVVFDIGGVFAYPDYVPVQAHLESIGVPGPADLHGYRRAHHAGVRALSRAEIPTEEHRAEFWSHYDRAYGVELGVGDQHLDDLSVAIRQRWSWVHEDNVAAFHRLAATGMPTAIVSNNDGTAESQMTEFGVCQVGPGPLPEVAAIVDSTVVGIAKPDPAIFTPALDALGLAPERVLYVGDTVHADVVGATAAGMQVIQLDPFDQHADYDHARSADLNHLVELLAA